MLTKISDGWWIDLSLLMCFWRSDDYESAEWYLENIDCKFQSHNSDAIKELESKITEYYRGTDIDD